MRFHRKLLLLSVLNFLGALALFFLFSIGDTNKESGGDLLLEGIVWMGFFFAFVPSLISTEVREEWYSKQYIYGSAVVFLLNVFIPILSGYVFLKLFQ